MAPIEFIIIINVVELIEEMWKPEEHMCLKSDFGPMINLWSLNETKAVDTRQPCRVSLAKSLNLVFQYSSPVASHPLIHTFHSSSMNLQKYLVLGGNVMRFNRGIFSRLRNQNKELI
ncbi:Uncharacterized protein TCM_000909 [Theobroma cacao]|uniref:Uncharacterized protein n=1 Tax=Theobroma cacao TaxID=3641 RepID=A0A061DPF7_THECC|nr:Uncharacterized protein TCM_000909 [Theobroma cacao]